MDKENTTSFKSRRSSSKLQKEPPQFTSAKVLKSQQSIPSLKRHPSAPVYPRSHATGSREHLRTKSNAYGSSSSSLEQNSAGPSPILATSEFYVTPGGYSSSQSRLHNARLSLNDRSSDELAGAPFDARGILHALDESASPTPSQQSQPPSAFRRPPPLHSSQTSPDSRGNQALRQSASFTSLNARMETTVPLIQDAPPILKRYSDEANGSRPAGPGRKKSTFTSLMNSVLGSPRNIKISPPENPVHVTHVGYDNQTGQFTVCPTFSPDRFSCSFHLPICWDTRNEKGGKREQ